MPKGMGKGRVVGHQGIGQADPNALDQSDLASDVMGNHTLQGDDQAHVRNERRAYPDHTAPAHTPVAPRPRDKAPRSDDEQR